MEENNLNPDQEPKVNADPNPYQYSFNQNQQDQQQYSNQNYQQENQQYQNEWQNSQQYSGQNFQHNNQQYQPIYDGRPTPYTDAVKMTGSSKAFLIGTIFYTLSFILSIFTAFNPSLTGAYNDYYGYSSGISMGSIIMLIPTLLMMIGMWIFYSSCAGANRVPSLGGIRLMRGVIIAYIVLISIAFVFITIFMIFIMTGASAGILYGIFGDAFDSLYTVTSYVASVVVSVVVVILILAYVFGLIYCIKLLKTTRVIYDILTQGYSMRKLSMYLIVINFILVGFYGIGVLGGLATLTQLGNPVTLISNVINIVSFLCITLSLVSLRSRLVDNSQWQS